MKTTTITLAHPITLPGQPTISEITLRRAKAIDHLVANEASEDESIQIITLLTNLAQVPRDAIEEMSMADFNSLKEANDEMESFDEPSVVSEGDPIALIFPIERADGSKLEYIKLRRPKVKDVLRAQKEAGSAERRRLLIFSIVSGVSLEDIQNLDRVDELRIMSVYADFLS